MKGGGGDCCLCYCQREVRTSSLLCFANRVIKKKKKKVSCHHTPASELVDLFPSSSPSLQQRTDLSCIVHGWQLINAWRRVRNPGRVRAAAWPRIFLGDTLYKVNCTPLPVVWCRGSVFSDLSRLSELSHFSHRSKLSHIYMHSSERWSIMIEFYSLWSATILKWGDFISHWHKFNSEDNLSSHSALLNIQFCELVAGTKSE